MSRIACQKNALGLKLCGHQAAAPPGHHGIDLIGNRIIAKAAAHRGVGIEVIGLDTVARSGDGQAPVGIAIDHGEIAPGALWTDQHIALGRPHRVACHQAR